MIRILIAGEGANELGEPLRGALVEGERPAGGGVIEALMAKVRRADWQVREAMLWKDGRKIRSNAPGDGDRRTVDALAMRAREHGCHALVFLRDRDRDRSRERAIGDAIREASGKHKDLVIVG